MANIYEIPNLTGGMDDAFVGVVTAVPSYIPLLLVFVFGVIFIGGAIRQKARTGSADLPMWASVSSLSTFLVSLIFTLRAGIIQLEILSIVATITIASGVWLFLSKSRGEA
jgi:hypothetical protein